ncbi:enoyl-CoA hydratase/isomerase family protein [Natranaerofaba carboxydovora]|uniref:enoyl-CoA hydratase/isomerase family protein n=1 Tax=Natranaerofaba carboxydovora TaxID=2742683 RepID=UPI001F12B9F0|nr:enoyl-CoA hydratase-related protein [Natranaerofaba carboxydovora]UMZ72954.1 Trans-2-decenoyl-[acyl-carrier-protein] isomerase [Natranaerofaba carboxydovora]
MENRKVLFEVEDNIAYITLNNPGSLNALDESLLDELIEVMDESSDRTDVRTIIISGKGNAFSAGGDLNALKNALEQEPEECLGVVRKVGLAALRIRNARKPVIASIKGAAAGAGFNFALACDFRICTEDAKFIQSFVNIGLVPDMGGTYLLTQMIGAAKATELIMTGRTVEAKEALELGLVNKVVPGEDLEKATKEFANKLAQGPTKAFGNMKALVNRSAFSGLESILDNELEYQINCAKTEDFKEGVSAFLEKRKPEFKGK